MLRMKNKKAYMFMLLLAIFTLAAVIAGLIAFSLTEGTPKEMLTPVSGLTQLYHDGNKFIIYARESAKISIAQAYYEAVYPKPLFVGSECQYDKFNKEFIELCSFSEDVYDKFASVIKDNLKGFIEEYPDERFKGITYNIEIKDNVVTFKTDKKEISHSGKEYSANYSFDPSFSIKLEDIGLTDFKIIYDTLISCKGDYGKRKYSEEEQRVIEDCVKKEIKQTMEITDNNEKIMFNIESKGFFLKDDAGNAEYKPIFLYVMVSKSDVTK